jgi:hypothetical protein
MSARSFAIWFTPSVSVISTNGQIQPTSRLFTLQCAAEPLKIALNYETFQKFDVYLKIILEEKQTNDKMEIWIQDSNEWSIMGGVYVHRYARSILAHRQENGIAGV